MATHIPVGSVLVDIERAWLSFCRQFKGLSVVIFLGSAPRDSQSWILASPTFTDESLPAVSEAQYRKRCRPWDDQSTSLVTIVSLRGWFNDQSENYRKPQKHPENFTSESTYFLSELFCTCSSTRSSSPRSLCLTWQIKAVSVGLDTEYSGIVTMITMIKMQHVETVLLKTGHPLPCQLETRKPPHAEPYLNVLQKRFSNFSTNCFQWTWNQYKQKPSAIHIYPHHVVNHRVSIFPHHFFC